MDQYFSETDEITMPKDVTALDEALKSVWDKVRMATQLISQLRDEKRIAASRTEDLERQVTSLRAEIQARDQEIKRLRAEHSQLVNANGQQSFSEEEKGAIKDRIRDLISKINSYL